MRQRRIGGRRQIIMEKRETGGMEIRNENKINDAEKNGAGGMKDQQKLTRIQMSETVLIGSLLALAGGFLDAYTYICRGGVFANAQTGNIVLFSLHLCQMEERPYGLRAVPRCRRIQNDLPQDAQGQQRKLLDTDHMVSHSSTCTKTEII